MGSQNAHLFSGYIANRLPINIDLARIEEVTLNKATWVPKRPHLNINAVQDKAGWMVSPNCSV